MQPSFVAVVIYIVSFFLTSVSMYTHVTLVLIKQCLLNDVFSMTKATNSQISPNQNFHSFYLLILFGKPCFS